MSPTSCPVGCDSWEFAAKYFGDCVCSRRDALSFTLGCVSIVAWGVAELPQIVANWRNKSSEGVSLAFIATWLTGDAFNLVGCAVSPTLPTQLYTAMLYTATTIVLVAQHLHYTKHSRNVKRETDRTAEDVEGRHAHDDDDIDGDDDDATRGGVDTRPLLGRHRRDASDDTKSDSFFESVGSHFGTTPGSARTFAALGSSSVNTRSHHSIGSHPAERAGSSGRRRPGHHDGGGREERRWARGRTIRRYRRCRPAGIMNQPTRTTPAEQERGTHGRAEERADVVARGRRGDRVVALGALLGAQRRSRRGVGTSFS